MQPALRHERRRGTVLVLTVMLLFGMLGLAAVVICMGMVILTQGQMQVAVDTASLEGLRYRDTKTEPERRTDAQHMASWVFDDDFDLSEDPRTGSNNPGPFGAGPVVGLSAGTGDADALRTINSLGVYDPVLQLNEADLSHGDMVAGTFDRSVQNPGFQPPPEVEQNPRIDEYVDSLAGYQRRFFRAAESDNAFLVRMRRSLDGLNDELEDDPGVARSGPTLPFLFGRGSFYGAQTPAGGYSPQQHGFTVRATAIADARPVKSVGAPDAEFALPGVTPFALSRDFWSSMPTDSDVEVKPEPDSADARFINVRSIGWSLANPTVQADSSILTTPPWNSSMNLWRYVPIFDTIDGSGEWIIGFGLVSVSNIDPLTVQRQTGALASENASASITQQLGSIDGALLRQIFEENTSLLQDSQDGGFVLLAPALVR